MELMFACTLLIWQKCIGRKQSTRINSHSKCSFSSLWISTHQSFMWLSSKESKYFGKNNLVILITCGLMKKVIFDLLFLIWLAFIRICSQLLRDSLSSFVDFAHLKSLAYVSESKDDKTNLNIHWHSTIIQDICQWKDNQSNPNFDSG